MKRIMHAWLFAALTLLSGSALTAPCVGFADVEDSNPFCLDVTWLRNRGVTLGCDAGGTLYCPFQPVGRLQMAAFMSRLGAALTPEILFVEVNAGPVDIQASSNNFVCRTSAYSPPFAPIKSGASYRKAVIHGLAWGIVDAAVVWSADLWYLEDDGVTWKPASNVLPFSAAPASGATQSSTFGRINNLRVGSTYVFAIRVRESASGPDWSGNFTDLSCRLMVAIGNGDDNPWDY